jgi:hypothetical protein
MLDLSSRRLSQIAVHKVGNRYREEDLSLTDEPLLIDDEAVQDILLKYFLRPFKNETQHFHFYDEKDINQNEAFKAVKNIFDDPSFFMESSQTLASLLYEVSVHPKINGGEFYVVHLTNILLDNELVEAVDIFKSETKETFLRVYPEGGGYEINYEEGISINKLDKGCLIFNAEIEKGFRLCVVDNLNRQEALYWKDDFLKVIARDDSYFHTHNYLEFCKDFVDERLKKDFDIGRVDEVNLMNKSVEFFKNHDIFDVNTFAQDVIQEPEIIDAFIDFKKEKQIETPNILFDEFAISKPAIKQAKKVYKSVIKLDKNFHIYVHGNRDWIERGFDEKTGLHYYKCFYKEEE